MEGKAKPQFSTKLSHVKNGFHESPKSTKYNTKAGNNIVQHLENKTALKFLWEIGPSLQFKSITLQNQVFYY